MNMKCFKSSLLIFWIFDFFVLVKSNEHSLCLSLGMFTRLCVWFIHFTRMHQSESNL